MYNNVPLLFLIDQLILEASAEIIQKIVVTSKNWRQEKLLLRFFDLQILVQWLDGLLAPV